MFEPKFITFQSISNGLEISGISILVDEVDYTGVKIAAQSLSKDLENVTGKPSPVRTASTGNPGYTTIILGSLQKSSTIQNLVKARKIDVSEIENKWEAFITCVVDDPIEGVEKALVLVGSDKRGTMFAAYTLCEQIGVSPWYWWADVPIQKHNTIFALPIITKQGDPSVKFRGIFINDEAPSLTGWVLEKFGPKYNSEFYKRVYDLLLRLKANFLWPAMWPGYPQPGNSFFEDDPLNQKLADDYGIVIGTSHHEPMQRAMIEWFNTNQGSWSWIENKEPIRKYFREGIERAKGYESYVTLGIRGDGDREMNVENPEEVIREVISSQREIIKDIHGDETSIRQLWALYKEVQVYYENGLPIPDDVTLLFSDDNFGTIRRLPHGEEMIRSGGAGLYYHLEYVGHPRSYKWLNSNTCGKIHQQLSTAIAQKANQIWVVNVGDIKPMEVPLTYIMSLAWDANCTSAATVPQFLQTMAEREFGSEYAVEVAQLLYKHDRLVALRRHEHIEPDTFSIINYDEAQNVVEAWHKLTDRAQELHDQLPPGFQPAFFQLVLHPIKASFIYTNIRVSQALNQLYGLQRRNTTNKMAEKVLKLFDEDFDLSQEFHAMLSGKWNHMMRQPHFGYGDTWHAPSRDLITGLSYVQLRQDSNPIVGQMGIAVEGSAGVRPGRTNEESDRTHPSRNDLLPGLTLPPMNRYGPSKRSFDIFARGSKVISWSVATQYQFLSFSATSGILRHEGDDQRIEVRVDWKSVPEAFDESVVIHIRSTGGDYEQVHLPLVGRKVPEDFHGFVETDGHISMHAVHFNADAINPLDIELYYEHLPSIGRNEDGGVHLKTFDAIQTPYLHYSIYCFSSALEVTATLYFTTVLDTNPSQPATYEVGFGEDGPRQFSLLEKENGSDLPMGWSEAAQNCAWARTHHVKTHGSGDYALVYRANGSGIVLEKIVLDFGGIRRSYLGPPESMRV